MTHTDPVSSYDIGDGVVMEADFSQDDLPVDPSEVVCLVRKPRTEAPDQLATIHDGQVVNDDGETVERYHSETVVDVSGDWYYRFEGSGAVAATGEKRFYVRPSKVL